MRRASRSRGRTPPGRGSRRGSRPPRLRRAGGRGRARPGCRTPPGRCRRTPAPRSARACGAGPHRSARSVSYSRSSASLGPRAAALSHGRHQGRTSTISGPRVGRRPRPDVARALDAHAEAVERADHRVLEPVAPHRLAARARQRADGAHPPRTVVFTISALPSTPPPGPAMRARRRIVDPLRIPWAGTDAHAQGLQELDLGLARSRGARRRRRRARAASSARGSSP